MKRLVSLFAAFALATTLFGTATTLTAPAVRAGSYYSDCVASSDVSRGFIWERTTQALGAGLWGVRLIFTAQALQPCTNGDGSHPSKSYILASMEGDVGGHHNIVQIGLMKTRYGYDQTRFGWTCNIGSATICPATWVDFNGDGNEDYPIAGRSYEVVVARHQTKTGYDWKYSIKDMVTGVWQSTYQPYAGGYTGSGSLGGSAWWGCETGTTVNALGTPDPDPNLYFEHAGYLKYNTSAWLYTQDSNVFDPSSRGVWLSDPSYYHFSQSQTGIDNTDKVQCYTTAH